MNIAIASDHAGFDLKAELTTYLSAKGHTITDFGTNSTESCDYPDYAHPLALSVEKGENTLGILICGSANGVCLTANKHQGIRAAIAWLPELGMLARQHNDANVICLPSRFIDSAQAKLITDAFITTDFEGGRHQKRVDKIPVV